MFCKNEENFYAFLRCGDGKKCIYLAKIHFLISKMNLELPLKDNP